jgi:hypothetical protein
MDTLFSLSLSPNQPTSSSLPHPLPNPCPQQLLGLLSFSLAPHHFVLFLVTASLICYLIWREVKYAAIVGVLGLLLKTVPIQTGLSKISSILRYGYPGRGNFIHYVGTSKLRVLCV